MKQKTAWTTPHQPPGKPRGYMSRNPAMGSPSWAAAVREQEQAKCATGERLQPTGNTDGGADREADGDSGGDDVGAGT